jgi:uncharacterized lipoprotein YddW (UPF0748 family)
MLESADACAATLSRVLALAVVTCLVPGAAAQRDGCEIGSPDAPTASELRACWLTHYAYVGKSEAELRALAQNIRAGQMNTVYVGLYSGTRVYWPSRAYAAAGGSWASPGTDYAAYLGEIFRDEGLKVGAWFEYGLALGWQDHPIAVAHPDWLARDRFGDPVSGENGGFVFLSPGHSEAVELVVGMVRELAEDYHFDDIQLDRIRWARQTTGREYGYEDCTAELYFAQYGGYPPANVNDPVWVAFREGLVNDVVAQCYAVVKSANPEIVVSSTPTGSYGITQHLQRWSDWVAGGYMDLVTPQMYQTTLSGFADELSTQLAQAPGHLDRIAVGFRASEEDDWPLVADQLAHARGQGIAHGCLWVYHTYTSQVAIQDEIDNLPAPGQPWEQPACNPFASDRMVQLVIDNDDGPPAYGETGAWTTSVQPGFFRFDSRSAPGGSTSAAGFSAAVPRTGRYDVSVWYTAAANHNDAAEYTIVHCNGTSSVPVDQRTDGGRWVHVGRYILAEGPLAVRVVVSTAGSAGGEYTSSDAVKLVLSGFAFGDADGNGVVDLDDFAALPDCLGGPGGDLPGEECEAFDFDDDRDVDLADVARFQQAFGIR